MNFTWHPSIGCPIADKIMYVHPQCGCTSFYYYYRPSWM